MLGRGQPPVRARTSRFNRKPADAERPVAHERPAVNLLPIYTLLVTLTSTLLITRIATVALSLTGMSRQSARFQARSAMTGVGFTTRESEHILNHPVRRRIVMWLMLLGNAGIVTIVATLMASLVNINHQSTGLGRSITVLGLGIFILFWLANSRWVDHWMSHAIEFALRRWTQLDIRDYVSLFRLSDGYAVSEIQVDNHDWIANKTLAELRLPAEGILVLGIQRLDQTYVGAPNAKTKILSGDLLIIYGPGHRIEELNRRREGLEGKLAHMEAVEEQQRVTAQQQDEGESPETPESTP